MLKTCLLLETDGERRVLAQKLYHRLAHTRALNRIRNTQAPPSNKPGTRFLQTLKSYYGERPTIYSRSVKGQLCKALIFCLGSTST